MHHLKLGFVEEDSSFKCLACPSSRSMKAASTMKHSRSPKHIENFRIRLLQREAIDVATAGSQQHVVDDATTSSEDNQVPYIGHLSDVDMDEDIEERRKELIDLWTKDYTNIFNTSAQSPTTSQTPSPAASVHGSEDVGDHVDDASCNPCFSTSLATDVITLSGNGWLTYLRIDQDYVVLVGI